MLKSYMTTSWLSAIAATAIMCSGQHAIGQCQVTRTSSNPGDLGGWSVDISGDYAVVGGPLNDSLSCGIIGIGCNRGSARVYHRDDMGTPADPKDDNWVLDDILVASDAETGAQFGSSVAIDGNYILVGSPFKNGSRGAAYLFARTSGGWTQQWIFTAGGDASANDQFGYSVALSKGPTSTPFVVVGAPRDDPVFSLPDSGAVYVFSRRPTIPTSWGRDAKLAPVGIGAEDWLGYAVAASDSGVIVAGAPFDDDGSATSGSAWIFTPSRGGGWSAQKITANSPQGGARFGHAVSIARSPTLNDDQIAIGEPYHNNVRIGSSWTDAGRGHIFGRNSSLQWVDKRTVGGPGVNEKMGWSVATSGDGVLFGSDRGGSTTARPAKLLLRGDNDWSNPTLFDLLGSDTVSTNDDFSKSVGLDGSNAIVGAPFASQIFSTAGASYIFAIQPDSDDDNYADVCDNCPLDANPDHADADGDGVGDVCDVCPGFDDNVDPDSDGFASGCDNCPADTNADQSDVDADGQGDVCDNCMFAANGPILSTCTAGATTSCTSDEDCDTSIGSLDGICSIPLAICVAGLSFDCTADVDCDSDVGTGDGVCNPNQSDQESIPDLLGDLCDNCPADTNANQGDYNGNGLGDVCDPAWNVADELVPPDDPAYASVTPDAYSMADVTPTGAAFYYDKVSCAAGTPQNCSQWEGRWFVNEPSVITIQWKDINGASVGDPVVYVATDSVGTPPPGALYETASVHYYMDWAGQGAGAPVELDTNFNLIIHYNSTFFVNNPPTTPSDVHVLGGTVMVEGTGEGKIVFQYTDGPTGRLVGLEVVDIANFGTPSPEPVDVGRQLAIPNGADCKASFITNAEQNGFAVAWQRSEAPLEVWPIRPEASASNIVVAWYDEVPFSLNCWHHSIQRFTTDWPSDPQPHAVVADATPDPPVVFLPVGDTEVYCQAEVVFPSQFTAPLAQLIDGDKFTASAPGYAVVRFDRKEDLPGASCVGNRIGVNFEVVRAFDHTTPYDDLTGEGVHEGTFVAAIGTQLSHPEHDPATPLIPFGYLQSGQPYAADIYTQTGQIFPVNSSDVHGPLEAWWFEEGSYAPGTFWPFRVREYEAQWAAPIASTLADPIIIASRSGAGSYPPGSEIYDTGAFGGPTTIDGWNPNDEHATLLPIAGSLRAFAVRDDNPWGVNSGHPYTLVKYPELLCSVGKNLCNDEAACGSGETCDPTGQWLMGVHEVIAEESPFFFDYAEFPNQSDPTTPVPVLAGLPIDPMFPVNFAAAACLTGTPPQPLTTVFGDALWVDRTGGIWAVEETTDTSTPQPSSGTVSLWENWAADGGCQPWRDFVTGDGTPTPITYRPSWPPAPPNCTYPTDPGCARPLAPGERVDVTGQCGTADVLHDSVGIRIIDPTHEVSVLLPVLPAGVDFTKLPPHLIGGALGGGGDTVPDRIRHELGGSIFFRGVMGVRDRELLLLLSQNATYQSAIFQLFNLSRAQLTTPLADPVEKWVSVADQSVQPGWVTLGFQDADACDPLPVSVEVWRVDCPGATGRIQVIQPTCPFNEKQVLQHTVDGGGRPELLIYDWQVSVDYDPSAPGLATWTNYNPPSNYANGIGLREVIIEGASPFTLADSWWRARYRGYVNCPCNGLGCNESGDPWPLSLVNDGTAISNWSAPQLAEGWVKRVVRGINPFDQRVAGFHSGPTSTYVDMIGQAGIRFESPVALNCTPANINGLGLIQVYETVLRRARSFSIDVGISYDPANLALSLVSSKVADLYMLLGNEAFADASDPTIGLFAEAGEPPLSYDPRAVFCFENQVSTVLEEELALLRGLDTVRPPDLDVEGRITATVYNRFPWNFTSGNGQVAYANNYQVTSVPAARAIYRQGHGDAYGHYLTSVKKMYTLLKHPVFEWIVSTESVLVGGQPVQVGFQYERSFAKAAAAKAKTGAAITSLTFRQRYDANPSVQEGYPDTQDPARAWGVADWARRTGQGAYFDWVTVNALLDDEDDEPTHLDTIRKIDRTTVLEIGEIAASYAEIQSTMDKADRGLNPLGLAVNVVPFGLNPSEIQEGKTHFEQIFDRAASALGNAVTAFDYANENTRRLRSQQDRVEAFQDLSAERERDFNGRLIEVFGKPYPEDIGLGKTYATGYDGPDILHFDYVEPSDLLGERDGVVVTVSKSFDVRTIDPNTGEVLLSGSTVDFDVSTDGLGLVKPVGWGQRPELGEIQLSRFELLQTLGRILQSVEAYEAQLDQIDAQAFLISERSTLNAEILRVTDEGIAGDTSLRSALVSARKAGNLARARASLVRTSAALVADALPTVVGLANDVSSVVRSSIKGVAEFGAVMFDLEANKQNAEELSVQNDLAAAAAAQRRTITGWEQEQQVKQQVIALQQLVRQLPVMRLDLLTLSAAAEQSTARYHSAVGRGLRLYEQLLAFRQKTARDVSQYRYRDMAFRVFRNDALQKYRAQFDMAARYAYLATRAYDYETNLLGTDSQAGRTFLTGVVKERGLGVFTGGSPLPGNGLAGSLAELLANWTVLKPQLGFNSLDEIVRTFSMRWESFRRPNSVAYDAEWRDILSSYRIPDLNALQEYNQYCQPLQPPVPNNPAIVIPLSTTVQAGLNLFGWPSTGDATLPSDRFAIKLHSHAIRFSHYPGFPLNQQANVYLVPVGADVMRTPTCPDAPTRQWHLLDQTLPIPFPIGNQDLASEGWMPWDALDGGSAAMVRRRLIPTVAACAFGDPQCTDISFKLTGRSVWNTRWLLIIPGSELLGADPKLGIDVFINGSSPTGTGVRDIKLLLNTYGYSGCVSSASQE